MAGMRGQSDAANARFLRCSPFCRLRPVRLASRTRVHEQGGLPVFRRTKSGPLRADERGIAREVLQHPDQGAIHGASSLDTRSAASAALLIARCSQPSRSASRLLIVVFSSGPPGGRWANRMSCVRRYRSKTDLRATVKSPICRSSSGSRPTVWGTACDAPALRTDPVRQR